MEEYLDTYTFMTKGADRMIQKHVEGNLIYQMRRIPKDRRANFNKERR